MRQPATLFIIAPRSADPEFKLKTAALAKIAADHGISPTWAVVTESQFSAGLGSLRDADLVLADLSFERPSCYFEVGFAQALGKTVALIARTGTAIHQVIGADTVLFYRSLSDYEEVVRQVLMRSVSVRKLA